MKRKQKDWFPTIDYTKCKGCMACVNKCTHGVYAIRGARPVVVKPHNCIFGCTGCQPVCPTGAITHPTPIKSSMSTKKDSDCACCCESDRTQHNHEG